MKIKTTRKPKLDKSLQKECESLFNRQNKPEIQWRKNGDYFAKLSMYGGYTQATTSNNTF